MDPPCMGDPSIGDPFLGGVSESVNSSMLKWSFICFSS